MDMSRILVPSAIIIVAALSVFKIADFLEDRRGSKRCQVQSIHRASLWEFGFGYLLILFSIGTYLSLYSENPRIIYHLFGVLLGVVWVCLVILLRRGLRRMRFVFLLLSALRIISVVGIPFSIASIWYLYVMDDSRAYYSRRN